MSLIKQQVRLTNYLSIFMTNIKHIVLAKTWYTKPNSLVTGFIQDIESRGSLQNHLTLMVEAVGQQYTPSGDIIVPHLQIQKQKCNRHNLKKKAANNKKNKRGVFFLLDFHILFYHTCFLLIKKKILPFHTYGFPDKNCNIGCKS